AAGRARELVLALQRRHARRRGAPVGRGAGDLRGGGRRSAAAGGGEGIGGSPPPTIGAMKDVPADLPGHELVSEGLLELAEDRESESSLLVAMAATRLRAP